MPYFNKEKNEVGRTGVGRGSRKSSEGIIESLNSKIEEQHKLAEVAEDAIERNYEKLLEVNEPFKGVFIIGEQNGDYSYFDGKYKVVMTKVEMERFGLFDRKDDKFNLLGEELDLKVLEIAKEPNEYGKYVVLVTFAGRPAFSFKQDLKSNITNELTRYLRRGENPIVWGVVVAVRERELLVRICDADVLGLMPIAHWQPGFTRSLNGLVKVGDATKFAVVRAMADKPKKDKAFLLSRKLVADDFWGDSQLYGLKEGETIVVTCIEVPKGKSYWWGVSERIPGLELMGDYTDNFIPENTIFPNIQYLCKVKRIEQVEYRGVNSYRVQVRPLEVCKHCRVTHANMRKLKGIKNTVKE